MAAAARPLPRWIYFIVAFIALASLVAISFASRLHHIDEFNPFLGRPRAKPTF